MGEGGVHGIENSLRDLFWEFGGEMCFGPICKASGKAGDSEVIGGRVTSLAAKWMGVRDRVESFCNLKYPSHRHEVYVNEELCKVSLMHEADTKNIPKYCYCC